MTHFCCVSLIHLKVFKDFFSLENHLCISPNICVCVSLCYRVYVLPPAHVCNLIEESYVSWTFSSILFFFVTGTCGLMKGSVISYTAYFSRLTNTTNIIIIILISIGTFLWTGTYSTIREAKSSGSSVFSRETLTSGHDEPGVGMCECHTPICKKT